jgi:hypothetical protein
MIWMKYAVGVCTCNIQVSWTCWHYPGVWNKIFFNLAQKHKEFAYPYMVTIFFRRIASKSFSIDRDYKGKNAPNIQ